MKTFYLSPLDGIKSFYNKCTVIEEGNISNLQSYNTIVAQYDTKTKQMTVNGYYSPTTMRHINSFLHFHGFKTVTKKQLEKQYLNN